MIDDYFVFDAVIHSYDHSDANLRDDQWDSPLARQISINTGSRIPTPGRDVGFPEDGSYERKWTPEELHRLVFETSGTDMAMAHTIPVFDWYRDGLAPVEANYRLSQIYPDEVVFCGGVDPVYHGDGTLDEMERQAVEWGTKAFKFYNAHVNDNSWRCDDEKLAYPMYEKARELGINILQFHKGIPLGTTDIEDSRAVDLQRAARDFPDMTFIIYHLAYPYVEECINIAARFPNIYLALSGNVAFYFLRPQQFYMQFGQALQDVGSQRLLWGSESPLVGNPQPYIHALATMQIPHDLQEGYGFPAITDDDRRNILGLNYARLLGIDPAAKTSVSSGEPASLPG
jgi:predicted TIM-barrel fold metal-dependent hydrolase